MLTETQKHHALAQEVELLEALVAYKRQHKREFQPDWYEWQLDGFSSYDPQVMLMAANRTGKTLSAGFHTACDLTADYPDWWMGFKQTHAIYALAMGVDNEQLKTVVQTELFGRVDDRHFEGGWIHPDEILRVEWSPQIPGLARRVTIKSKYGRSVITLRAYTQSKTGTASLSFAGSSIDLIWIDECPPDPLVGQLVTRTMTGNLGQGGRIRYTMTPELGATQLVSTFLEDRQQGQKLIGPVSWDECPHLTPEIREQILSAIPPHEQEMRSKGIPFFGSGLVYPVPESRIIVDPMYIPPYWRCIRAIDLGIHHPTAIAWLAHSPEDDVIYVVKTYAVSGENAATHAAAANSYWSFAPCVFPHDVDITERGSGKTIRQYYNDAGLTRTMDFKNVDGSISVDPGIFDIYERMRDGRFKVFSTCTEFWREFRLYHRQEGKLVKENDDVMDAVRYGAIMIGRYGVPMNRANKLKPKVKRSMKGKTYRT
jgi:phage terminase large subunit-like protein